MGRRRSYEQQADDIERRIAQLREQRREVLARESEADRKGESAMRFALGGLLLEHFDGGWRTVDLGRLEAVFGKSHGIIAACVAEELPVEHAARRMRDWQRAHKGASCEDGGE